MYSGEVGTQAKTWKEKLSFECDEKKGEAVVRIKGTFTTSKRDHQLEFNCATIADTPAIDCKWHNKVTHYLDPIGFTCPPNFYISGLKSYHTDKKEYEQWKKEHKKWAVKCCRSLGYQTESCELTKDYITDIQGSIEYKAKQYGCEGSNVQFFFTGFQIFPTSGSK